MTTHSSHASTMPAPPAEPTAEELRLAEENLSAARLIVRNRTPYFISALLSMVMVPTPACPTIGTTATFVVVYNPSYIGKQDAEKTAGLLVHEILHVWNAHFTRMLAETDADKRNRALDRAINPSVVEAGFKLPPNGCFPRDIGAKDGLTAEEYFDLEPEGQGDSGGGVGAGSCGGCAGNPGPGEPAAGDTETPGRSEAEIARTFRQVAEAINDAVDKRAGSVPGAWSKMAAEQLKPARVPWQEKLAYAARNALAYRDGATIHKYDAPSRRQAGLGYGDGVPVLPRMREEVPDVLVGLDTSGSMGGQETEDALAEVDAIFKAVGAEVRFGVCDAEMHGLRHVDTIQQARAMLKGGGGTDFNPFFQAALASKPTPSLIVFFTDGYGPAPAEDGGVTTIWVYVGPHVHKPVEWGIHIRIPANPEEDVEEAFR